ncbi:mechanosensitive ion channel family protein [Actinomadura sp. DC4]|uniref:mechanosensitive ion channel family protein n=1 Tax=Actinomadura sp. DC4 TaxID=3055069 RepID=UPI0025AFB455|nr:mechanosensitive ion channel family protein [Actinomadura sp. DC4]MDN3355235.1 mechanosensitive ion channel family protein [Actinomadura sp. DC4]
MSEPMHWERLVVAAAIVAGALMTGLLLRAMLSWLTRRAGRTRWAWDDLLLTLLRDLAVVSSSALGLWAAVLIVPLRPSVRQTTDSVLVAVLILTISVAVARFAAGAVSSVVTSRAGVAQSATIFVNIVRVAVVGIGMLVLLQSLGVSVTPLLTALGVGGLAVALALQDTLANLFAGVHILVSRKVQQGDYVRIDSGQEGYIVDINWRNTTIRQLAGNLVIVPNAKFADAILTNYHRPEQDLSIQIKVGVGYGSDLEWVEKVTLDVAHEVLTDVDGGLADQEPSVRFQAFGESSIDFGVNLRTREFTDQYVVVHEFIKRLHRRYQLEGIEIPYPTRVLRQAGQPGYN